MLIYSSTESGTQQAIESSKQRNCCKKQQGYQWLILIAGAATAQKSAAFSRLLMLLDYCLELLVDYSLHSRRYYNTIRVFYVAKPVIYVIGW